MKGQRKTSAQDWIEADRGRKPALAAEERSLACQLIELGDANRPPAEFISRLESELSQSKEAANAAASRGRKKRRSLRLDLRSGWGWGIGLGAMAVLLFALIFGIERLVFQKNPAEQAGVGDPDPVSLIPVVETAATVPADSLPPLSLESSPEEIRERILSSHTRWSCLWAEAVISLGPQENPEPVNQPQYIQIWVRQPAEARILSGSNREKPSFIWISDGEKLRNGEDVPHYLTGEPFTPSDEESGAHQPHPMTRFLPTPLSELLFPGAFALRKGDLQAVGMGRAAGRDTLLVEGRNPDGALVNRFWIDVQTGIILRIQNYGKAGGDLIAEEIIISSIQYDPELPEATFDRLAPFPPAFASTAQDIFASEEQPVEAGQPPVELDPGTGEIYVLLSREQPVGLIRIPAECLANETACPQVDVISDFPSRTWSQGIAWSPDGQRFLIPSNEGMKQWMYDRSSQTWTTLEAPYISNPAWSPDGEWIVGTPTVRGDQTSNPLLLFYIDRTEARTILEDEPGFKDALGWVDEEQIVFSQVLDNVEPGFHEQVQVFNLETGELTLLLDIHSEEGLSHPVLSPDGSRLVYGRYEGEKFLINVLNLTDGSTTSFPFSVPGGLAWSRDGEWVVVTAALGYTWEMHLVSPDSREARKLFSGDFGDAQPGNSIMSWSPDGEYLLIGAFAQNPSVPRLYRVSIQTGQARLVELPDTGVEFSWAIPFWVK